MKPHKRMERLVLFGEVADTLNFGTAAEKIGISRSYLSEQIRQLELSLGVKLLQRSTRNVNLTREGAKVYADVQKINRTLVELEQNLHTEHTGLRGQIAITAPNLFAHFVLTQACLLFNQQHSDVTFSLNTSYQPHDLNRGHYDLAFRSTSTPPQDMVAKPLFSYHHVLVASPIYSEKYGLPENFDQLARHQCLSGPEQDYWVLNKKRVVISGWIKLNDNLSLIKHVLDGHGIARLPEYIVRPYLQKGVLVPVLPESSITQHKLFIVHPPKPQQSARVRAFTEYMKQNVIEELQ